MRFRIVSVLLIISIIVNVGLLTRLGKSNEKLPQENGDHPFPYLSKRIFMQNQNDIIINFVPLRNAVRNYVEKQNVEIGVYFEYLPSGTSIGINDRMEVRFASLIKLPVVMAVYKDMEKGDLKKDTILTVSEENVHKGFGELWKKGAGTKITVKEAIDLSIKESDNTALRALVSALPKGAIEDVFDNLDITIDTGLGYPIISPKNYSSILRSLYLSSYLQYEDSNEIIDLLTNTKFNDKIPAGVSQGIKVAHKIGLFELGEKMNVFSDCGIIYAPNRPYSLCIMVKSDEDSSRNHMVHISQMIYGYIERVSKP